MSEGVEWAAHVCALLAALPPGRALSVGALAEFHEVPKAYLAKHCQALARAGLLRAHRGPSGGYSLAKPAQDISLWDVRAALDGGEPEFRCQELRRRGPCPSRKTATPCTIAAAYWDAEARYRERLRETTVADIVRAVGEHPDPERAAQFVAWLKRAR